MEMKYLLEQVSDDDIYNYVIQEKFDPKNTFAMHVLNTVPSQQAKMSIMSKLGSRLYLHIKNKSTKVDYDYITQSKGVFINIKETKGLLECLNVLEEYNVQPELYGTIMMAISNIEKLSAKFKLCYSLDLSFGKYIYENIALSIFGATSLLIALTVDFIKSPGSSAVKLSGKTVKEKNLANYNLYRALEQFNDACATKQMDKALDFLLNTKHTQNVTFAVTLIGSSFVVAFILLFVILPMLREMVYFFYYSRIKMSEWLELQAKLLEMNANKLEANHPDMKADKIASIRKRQTNLAKNMRKLADKISVDAIESSSKSSKDIQKESDSKYQDLNGIYDEHPTDSDTSSSSDGDSLF